MVSPVNWSTDFGEADGFSGQLNPDKMVTSKITLSEVVEKGFKSLLENRDEHCKILVVMKGSGGTGRQGGFR
jgi:hypothetical protein